MLSLFCVHLFVVCLLFCVCFCLLLLFSHSLSLSLSLGMQMKTKPVLFFLQRALNISVLHFLSFYVLSLFFSKPLWCVCGFVIIPFGWAHRRRCGGTHMHLALSHTHSHWLWLFMLETSGIHMQVCILVCLSVFSMCCSTHITAHTILKCSCLHEKNICISN